MDNPWHQHDVLLTAPHHQSAEHMSAVHGMAGSAPNLAHVQALSGMHAGFEVLEDLRCHSFSGPGSTLGAQLQQRQPFAVGSGVCMDPVSASATGQQFDVQRLEWALAALAAQPQTPSTGNSLQAADVADSAQEKLQLLDQLQLLIQQQQQQLTMQLQLQGQHTTGAALNRSASANLASVMAAAAGAAAARMSTPGCMGNSNPAGGHDDIVLARDQIPKGVARAGAPAGGGGVLAGQLQAPPLLGALGPAGHNTPLQLQLQRHLQQQQYMHAQQEVMSPCAFVNTPTALAALPPSLLAEVGCVGAAGSCGLQAPGGWQGHNSSIVAGHRLSYSDSGSPAGCYSSAGTTPTAAGLAPAAIHGGKGSRLSRLSGPGSIPVPLTNSTGSGGTVVDGSAALLHLQLQQAIAQLANLQVSSTTSGVGAGPANSCGMLGVSHSSGSGSRGWDCWGTASVGDLLRADSTLSRTSSGMNSVLNRASSGIPSDTSVGSNIWSDVSGTLGGGLAGPGVSLGLPSSAGVLLCSQGCQGGLDAALQRTTSNMSCASVASVCSAAGMPYRSMPSALSGGAAGAAPGMVGGRRNSVGGGNAAGSMSSGADFVGSAGAACAGVDAASAAAAAEAAVVRPRVAGSSSSHDGCKHQDLAEPAASVDTLLRSCAPRWAKAGWNPKASVAAAPAVAAKGTGAFVRLSASSGSSTTSPEGKASSKASSGSVGTGAFIPPAVRAAAAGLSCKGPPNSNK